MNNNYTTQNDLLLKNLMSFYKTYDEDGKHNPQNNLDKMLKIITGESKISLRIVDWFATNYAKKYYTLYVIDQTIDNIQRRFKVYDDYKLKLKAYSKKRFDPFCRWDRISIPYTSGKFIETDNSKTRKKREELSISATKSIKKEKVEIVVQFN